MTKRIELKNRQRFFRRNFQKLRRGNKLNTAQIINFDQLVKDNSRKVYNTVYCVLGNVQDTEDVVQEIFFQVYMSLPKFEGRSDVTTWLYRIVMNVTGNHIKKNRRRARMSADLSIEELELLGKISKDPQNVEKQFERTELNRVIQKALVSLPLQYRSVFVLREIGGYSYREIGDILDISIGTVESRLFRARETLKNELQAVL